MDETPHTGRAVFAAWADPATGRRARLLDRIATVNAQIEAHDEYEADRYLPADLRPLP